MTGADAAFLWEVAERARDELWALPRDRRMQGLLELMLRESEAALPDEPRRTWVLAGAARHLTATRTATKELSAEALQDGLVRALCLQATARRLVADFERAERLLEQAALVSDRDSPSRALVYRCQALVRWDQEGTREAASLLRQAERMFSAAGLGQEAVMCFALLGLLRVEEGELREGAQLLALACLELGAERPWLAAQAQLGLALCRAAAGKREQARAGRQEAGELAKRIGSPVQLLSLQWLDAQVAAELGDAEGAAQLLDALRRKLLELDQVPEAVMVALDLGLVWRGVGRRDEVEALIEEMEAVCERYRETSPDFDLSLNEMLAIFAAGIEASAEAPSLRSAFVRKLACLRPVPFG